ncbi:hypothetical protein KJ840_01190 [Patescibacteria group bacterium]|nr:hypothetical protein [Patescibacteria group bacterium]
MTKTPEKRLYHLRLLFIIFWSVLIITVLSVPHIIHEGIAITGTFILEEELIESILIVCLLIIVFFILKIYQKVLRQYQQKIIKVRQEQRTTEERLNDAFSYIGAVNVQLQEIHSALNAIDKYPEHRKDFFKIMALLGDKILGIVKVPWLINKVILTRNYQTLAEHVSVRKNEKFQKILISNKELIENRKIERAVWINSGSVNLTFTAYCLMPEVALSSSQKILIQAVLKQLEMLYLVLQSQKDRQSNQSDNSSV